MCFFSLLEMTWVWFKIDVNPLLVELELIYNEEICPFEDISCVYKHRKYLFSWRCMLTKNLTKLSFQIRRAQAVLCFSQHFILMLWFTSWKSQIYKTLIHICYHWNMLHTKQTIAELMNSELQTPPYLLFSCESFDYLLTTECRFYCKLSANRSQILASQYESIAFDSRIPLTIAYLLNVFSVFVDGFVLSFGKMLWRTKSHNNQT